MSKILLLSQLKEQLVLFFDELIELLPLESDLVIIRIFINDKIPITDVMNYVIRKLIPLKNLVQTTDDKFFINNNILFEQLDQHKVNHFKRIWTTGNLDSDDKKTIWKWFATFIYLAEKYSGSE